MGMYACCKEGEAGAGQGSGEGTEGGVHRDLFWGAGLDRLAAAPALPLPQPPRRAQPFAGPFIQDPDPR